MHTHTCLSFKTLEYLKVFEWVIFLLSKVDNEAVDGYFPAGLDWVLLSEKRGEVRIKYYLVKQDLHYIRYIK